MANMGRPKYGGTLMGRVVYIEENEDACETFDSNYTVDWITFDLPVILLVQEGECLWTTKIWNGQQAGANAVLVGNFAGKKKLKTMTSSNLEDGSQYFDNITIPAAMIDHNVANEIINTIFVKREEVIVQFNWEASMPNPDDFVEMELWYTSYTGCGKYCDTYLQFMKEFEPIVLQLVNQKHLKFYPHLMFNQCKNKKYCQKLCIKKGRYCSFHNVAMENVNSSIFKTTAWQNLRHLCVINLFATSPHSDLHQWWHFTSFFATYCDARKSNYTDACANDALRYANISISDIDKCMGSMEADEKMHVIYKELARVHDVWKSGRGKVSIFPTIVINREQYRGKLEVESVLRAICAGFEEGTEPAMCLSGGLNFADCGYGVDHGCWMKGDFSACVDTFRGHKCICPKGWRGDGINCEDIDECAEGISGCEQGCVNSEGSFHCTCEKGYKLFSTQNTGGICLPEDPCIFNNGGCEGLCLVVSPGRSVCRCGRGLELADDDHSCMDIDECDRGLHDCKHKCVNKDARDFNHTWKHIGYSCECDEGFIIDPSDGVTCVPPKAYLHVTGLDKEVNKRTRIAPAYIFYIIFASVMIVVIFGFATYKLWLKYRFQKEVKNIIGLYMPLELPESNKEEEKIRVVKEQKLFV
eukprot:TRINITY_DN6303_c0_g1_i4.p1 TRINITY_DN6303_c0_g1~~TRINITY_DN6303_c0_g1_i4.p1  ORF type:complete len:735 (+),score=84.16 TRINITY_DN6303_c0_g1_i4:283-2205(+)